MRWRESLVNLVKLFLMYHMDPSWVLFLSVDTYATCSIKAVIWILLVVLLTIPHIYALKNWTISYKLKENETNKLFDCFQNIYSKSNIDKFDLFTKLNSNELQNIRFSYWRLPQFWLSNWTTTKILSYLQQIFLKLKLD